MSFTATPLLRHWPLLCHCYAASSKPLKEAERELIDAGKLANALLKAGRYAEAEQMLRDLIDQCVAQGNYRQASANAGDLLNLLMALGRFEEALPLAEQKADYTRRAGLGPWTQLGDETMRLQVLNALGRYQEVLDARDSGCARS